MKADKQAIHRNKRNSAKPVIHHVEAQGFVMKSREIFLLAVVIIVTIVIYYPALNHQFTNWDDNDYITENPYIKSLSPANLEHVFTKPIALNYHPLTILSLALNYQVSGTEPFSYFLVNIILHLFNTLLTFYLALLLLDRNKTLALFVAAIFAVHPMHVESVAWISERKDVLYGFFFLSGMISWVLYIGKRRWYWYLLSLMLFLLAGLSKPSSVVFPLILLLMDYFFKRKFNLLLVAEKIPFFAISVVIGMATIYAQMDKSIVDIKNYNLVQQVLFASYGFFIYIFKLIIPAGLSALHPVPVFNTSLDLPWVYFAAPVINVVIAGLVLYSLKYTRILFFCLMFYFLNILLTLQFMQVGSAVMAERYTYISYIGLLIGIAWLINQSAVKHHLPKHWVYLVMGLFFGISTVLSVKRVAVWKNSGTLWTDVIARYPRCHTAYNNRGYYYVNENLLDNAMPDFTKSLEILPTFVDALNNRGSLYRLQNFPRQAIPDYNKALSIDPNHIKALCGRGNAYTTLGVLDSALLDFNKAYQINPSVAIALGDRGAVFFRLGQFENAIEDCSRKIAVDPLNTSAYLNRAVAYSSLRKWDPAIRDYSFVLKTRSDNPAVYEWRGVAYRSIGSLQLAIDDFSHGIKVSPTKSSLYVNRAMAYQLAGMNRKAADDIKMARQLGAAVTEQSVFSGLK
jgi:protein O-mannosyl-transferase